MTPLSPRPDRPTTTSPPQSPIPRQSRSQSPRAGTTSGAGAGAGAGAGTGARARAWAELLRLPALFTVPGDALAGAATTGNRPNPRTLLAIASSLCLYEAGMALNDWADRTEDALERPHRPLPSGRIHPSAALVAAGALTAAGLALAARAGRPALAVAAPLAATVWAYDLALKRTPAGPAAMATARGLDLLLGATATGGSARPALPAALTLATHTLAVTTVSRDETRGGSPLAPLAALATTGTLAWTLTRPPGAPGTTPSRYPAAAPSRHPAPVFSRHPAAASSLRTVLAAAFITTSGRPLLHAALNPSPPLTQRAVGGGIRAMIPLQAALAARSGALASALLTAALAPAARRFARKVSVT
ncbi:SCO3242 family prenyltransferase [Streptomyces mirabilis]|uniref:SCO3242 family prenyltransferase n=1 Tax=Streptomyces mirabilis TaxID=68239 RepID=UPI002E2F0245|nr:UbiA family prenyltransferase [Streptomyces mirabilis]